MAVVDITTETQQSILLVTTELHDNDISDRDVHHDGDHPPTTSSPLPVYAQVIVIVAYATIIVVSVGGNSLVVAAVATRRSMRTVTNWFILNLACADMLMASLCIPMTFVSDVLLQYWPFHEALCPLVGYAQATSVFLGAFTLIGISIDRHRAIRHPLRARLTGNQLTIAVGIIWTAALLFPLPIAIFNRAHERVSENHGNESSSMASTTASAMSLDSSRVVCVEIWPDWWRYSYSITVMIAQYFLPLAVLTATYASITYVVWLKRRPPGEPLNERDNRLSASKKKMVKMMITVVVIYALCWLPLHTITLTGDADPNIWTYRHMHAVWVGSHWLAMSNCCYNPFVYYWMSSNFRRGYVDIIRRVTCRYTRRTCNSRPSENDDRQSACGSISVATRYSWIRRHGCCAATTVDSDYADGCGGGFSTTLVDESPWTAAASSCQGQGRRVLHRSQQKQQVHQMWRQQDIVEIRMSSVVPAITVTVIPPP